MFSLDLFCLVTNLSRKKRFLKQPLEPTETPEDKDKVRPRRILRSSQSVFNRRIWITWSICQCFLTHGLNRGILLVIMYGTLLAPHSPHSESTGAACDIDMLITQAALSLHSLSFSWKLALHLEHKAPGLMTWTIPVLDSPKNRRSPSTPTSLSHTLPRSQAVRTTTTMWSTVPSTTKVIRITSIKSNFFLNIFLSFPLYCTNILTLFVLRWNLWGFFVFQVARSFGFDRTVQHNPNCHQVTVLFSKL